MVDRYKFLDLFPCGPVELKSIGYSDVTGLLTAKVPIPEVDEVVSQLPRPDFAQMIPYKPKASAYPGEHPLAGGTFPQPQALASLCSQLPPPVCFRGPFVAVDSLIEVFNRIQLPEGTNGKTKQFFFILFRRFYLTSPVCMYFFEYLNQILISIY